jgi:hypothetical protein
VEGIGTSFVCRMSAINRCDLVQRKS